MRGTVRALIVAVAALSCTASFAVPFARAALFIALVRRDGYIKHFCANGQDALSLEFTAETTLALKILTQLIGQFVFASVLIDIQLFLCPVPFERFPEWKLIAAAVPEVNEKPQHDPAGPGNTSNAMGEYDEKENAADAEKTQHASDGEQACHAVFAAKSDIERYFKGPWCPWVFETQREQRNKHQHVGRCRAKGIHVGQDIIDIGRETGEPEFDQGDTGKDHE